MQPDAPTPAEPAPDRARTGLVAVGALCAILLVAFGGTAAVGWWQQWRAVGFSAQGAAAIAVSADKGIAVTVPAGAGDGLDLVWRLGERPDLVGRFPGGAPVTFAPGSRTVVVAATAVGAAVWSLDDPRHPVRVASLAGPGAVRGIAYAPDHTTLAVAYPTAVRLWDMTDPSAPNPIADLPSTAEPPDPWAHVDYQDQVAFSPDGHLLAVTASGPAAAPVGPAVSLWDVTVPERPALLTTLRQDMSVAALAFSPGGAQLASLGRDGTVTVYDLTDVSRPAIVARLVEPRAAHVDWTAYALSYSPDGTGLVAVVLTDSRLGSDRHICVWTLSAPTPAASACRTDQIRGSGAITFTTDHQAIVGPDLGGADAPTVWPTAIGPA